MNIKLNGSKWVIFGLTSLSCCYWRIHSSFLGFDSFLHEVMNSIAMEFVWAPASPVWSGAKQRQNASG